MRVKRNILILQILPKWPQYNAFSIRDKRTPLQRIFKFTILGAHMMLFLGILLVIQELGLRMVIQGLWIFQVTFNGIWGIRESPWCMVVGGFSLFMLVGDRRHWKRLRHQSASKTGGTDDYVNLRHSSEASMIGVESNDDEFKVKMVMTG